MNSANLNLVFFCIAEKASKPEELCGYIAAGDSVIQLFCVSRQYIFFLLHSSSIVKFLIFCNSAMQGMLVPRIFTNVNSQ
jgi:hypothetical protein